jgi:surface polysaccharide O-acyltransferase-like enzyme
MLQKEFEGKMLARRSNIELIRIISMLMIVFHHYAVHSKWVFSEVYSNRQYFIEVIGSFGKIGVILFVLITGYFLTDSTWKPKKLSKLWGLVTFYSLSIYLLFLFLGKIQLSKYGWGYLFPIPLSLYWFPTYFFFLYLLLPMLKTFVAAVDNKKILSSLILFICAARLSAVLKNVTDYGTSFSLDKLFLMIIFVLIGYLIKEYEDQIIERHRALLLILGIFSFALIIAGPKLINSLNDSFSLHFSHYFLAELNSLTALVFSVCLFILLLKVNIQSLLVKLLGSCMFAVLLIHDNPIVRDTLWVQTFKNAEHFLDPWPQFILRAVAEPLLVFFLCVLIELARKTILKFLRRFRSTELAKNPT